MITNDYMLKLTANMPMKQIDVNGKPYMQRYFAGTTADDYDIFIHRFLSADGEEHLHSHPRDSYSLVITGGYNEETGCEVGSVWLPPKVFVLQDVLTFPIMISAVDFFGRHISVFDWHRITSVEPETWSMFIVGPYILPFWCFKEKDGTITPVASSPRDWWKSCGVRG